MFKKKLHCSYKKTRLVPSGHPDKKTQEWFIKEINKMVNRAKKTNDEVLFSDPTHQVHNTENDYCWQLIGKQGTKTVNSNAGRERVTILGALNPLTLRPTTVITESNCDQEAMQIFLEQVRKEYKNTDTIYLILDNAKYHYAKTVDKKAKELGIELIYLPPYSPNLNLIERLWKFLKKKLKKNRFYDTFEKFIKAIYEFFKNIDQYQEELKSLLTLEFEII